MLARFVTFAFAAADILIETDSEGCVGYVTGATSCLPAGDGVGRPLADLVDADHRSAVRLLVATRSCGQRIGPLDVRIAGRRAHLSGWRMEETGTIGWAVEFAQALPDLAEVRDALKAALPEVIDKHRAERRPLAYTFINVGETPEGEAGQERFFAALHTLARSAAIDEAGGLFGDHVVLAAREAESEVFELDSAIGDICAHAGLDRKAVAVQTFADDPDFSGDQVVAALHTIAEQVDATGALPPETTLAEATAAIAAERQKRLSALSAVIRGRRFEPYAQVIVDAFTGEEAAYELLARMPGGKAFEPGVLMAEKFGMVRDLDLSMLEFAIGFLKNGPQRPPLAVNLSGSTLSDLETGSKILKMVEKSGIDRSRLAFEVTETLRIDNFSLAANLLDKLKSWGCGIALDDFGSGAAGLDYLQRLPVRTVKFEASIVDNAMSGEHGYRVARATFAMMKALGISVTVERIETEHQAGAARRLGASRLQGWLFGKAMPLSTLMEIHKPDARRAGARESFA